MQCKLGTNLDPKMQASEFILPLLLWTIGNSILPTSLCSICYQTFVWEAFRFTHIIFKCGKKSLLLYFSYYRSSFSPEPLHLLHTMKCLGLPDLTGGLPFSFVGCGLPSVMSSSLLIQHLPCFLFRHNRFCAGREIVLLVRGHELGNIYESLTCYIHSMYMMYWFYSFNVLW